MLKLRDSIPSTNMKIIELYNKIHNGSLELRPGFQRKLVWKKQHKFHFIETILLNYPFPEVYIASTEMNVDTITTKDIVVDGQQRLSTIVNYIKESDVFEDQKNIKPFSELSDVEKKEFLNYQVIVRDLKNLPEDQIKEIFQRINNTEYSLNIVEKYNAQYGDSEFFIFSKQLLESSYTPTLYETDIIINIEDKKFINNFFESRKIFTNNDSSRMLDLQYIMVLCITIFSNEYVHRNSKVEEYLKDYNDEFDFSKVLPKLIKSMNLINKLELGINSYWFNKANIFTLIIELSKNNINEINIKNFNDDLIQIEKDKEEYFKGNKDYINNELQKYFEYAKEGVNDKAARIYRGEIISKYLKKYN